MTVMNTGSGKNRKVSVDVIEKMAEDVVGDMGMELVGVELKVLRGKPHLIVYIDKPGGVFIEDCERVSRALEEIMDIEDPIPSSYVLEVSSPGIERILSKREDFARFAGEEVKIKTFQKITGRRNFTGVLLGCEDELVTIRTEEAENVTIPLGHIAKANLSGK